MRHALVVGGDGRLGRALAVRLAAAGVRVTATTRRPGGSAVFLDLAAGVEGFRPPPGADTVILCAAMTDQRGCAQAPDLARRINVEQTLRLADLCRAAGLAVVFPSTNLVFDGTRPHRRPDEVTCPRTLYGRLKAEAEERLMVGGGVAVLRLTKVFAADLVLLRGWADTLRAGRPVRAFADMVAAPVAEADAADALLAAVGTTGIRHLSGAADLSYAALARRLAAAVGAPSGLVEAVSWRDAMPDMDPAMAPAHTTLAMPGGEPVPVARAMVIPS